MSLLDKASLIVTPNAVKESKLYSVVPSSGAGDMDVVRATTATRVNSTGLIEVVPRNFIAYSQDFANAAWTKTGATFSVDTLTGSAGTSLKGIFQAQTTNGVQSAYFDVQYVSHRWIQILIGTTGSDVGYVNYDIQNKVVGDQSIATGSIVDFGTFLRIYFNFTTANKASIVLALVDSGTATRAESTSSTNSLKLFRSQNELGTATEYFPTTTRLNIPRINYTNGSCPSLLVEPQRTNLALYSQQFDNVNWVTSNATITANSIISPDGTQNAERINLNSGTASKVLYQLVVSTLNGTYSLSWFMKYGTHRYSQILIGGDSDPYANFDLQNGVLGSSAFCTPKIENYGNGWYRCTMSFTTGFGTAIDIFAIDAANAARAASSSSTGYFYTWGAQLEVGSYATSYIPTVASTVTRNADVISKTGISSLIGQTEGTIFVEEVYDANVLNNGGLDDTLISLTDGTSNNLITIFHYGGGVGSRKVLFFVRLSGTTQAAIFSDALVSGTYKIALAYKNNDIVGYINGVQIGTDTSATIPATSVVTFYDPVTTNSATKTVNIKSAQLYKTRLSNTELAQLTTL